MSDRSLRVRVGGGRLVRLLLAGAALTVGAVRADGPGERPVSWEPRVPLGASLSPAGTLLSSERPWQPWQAVGARGAVHSRDRLLALPGVRAAVGTRPGGVELTLWGNLPEQTPFPGRECAVTLHDSRSYDLDFTLERGRAIVTNRKTSGPARVWLRVEGAAFPLTLAGPGDAVCLGLYGRWPRGSAFALRPGPGDVPARSLTFLVLKGQVDLKAGSSQFPLSAPPGPATYHWDNHNGADEGPGRLDRVEPWADPSAKEPAEARPIGAAAARFADLVKEHAPEKALADMLAEAPRAADAAQARAATQFAVFGLAAVGDLERVVRALADPKSAEARAAAVVALRHWIGDTAGRDLDLYHFLIDRVGYPKAQAEALLQLLHTPFAPDQPETYETLIAFLRHENLAIRELAWWHLSRLVPRGPAVRYDPAAPAAERKKAYDAWKALIPAGSLPPGPKK